MVHERNFLYIRSVGKKLESVEEVGPRQHFYGTVFQNAMPCFFIIQYPFGIFVPFWCVSAIFVYLCTFGVLMPFSCVSALSVF